MEVSEAYSVGYIVRREPRRRSVGGEVAGREDRMAGPPVGHPLQASYWLVLSAILK